MRQVQELIVCPTVRQGIHDITRQVTGWVGRQGMGTGLLTVFLQHVSAHLMIQEHADKDDLHTFFRRLEFTDERFGEFHSTVHSHQLCIPVREGQLALGTRQRVCLMEHREAAQKRSVVLHLVGE